MTDDEQIRDIITQLEHVQHAIVQLGKAGLMVASHLDVNAAWMEALSIRVAQLEDRNKLI